MAASVDPDIAQHSHTITFVHNPNIQYDQNYGTYFTPLWAYTLASYVPDNWSVTICDCKIDDINTVVPADVFAFSGINQDIDSIGEAHDLLKAKYPNAKFILGGPITWSLQQEGKLSCLEYFDYLFIMDGEETLPLFLRAIEGGACSDLPKIIQADRFSIQQAKHIRIDLLIPKVDQYYGAVLEVSRGCPFLCEFCDIRVLPGNNQSNNKPVDLIIEELDNYYNLGIAQIQFACDNFIGEVAWARDCVDAIIDWKERTGANISLFTWLTVNLYKMPDLMEKMRKAGFSILFIGIESVNQNSLLETAKVQNVKALDLAVRTIQAYGFIIAPGMIFGFDSDTNTVFEDTLDFFIEVGLIGGDPSFLMALSGTPLYRRMEQTGRLVERKEEIVVRKKIETNIRYLQDTKFLKKGFVDFIRRYTTPDFQFARFNRHMDLIMGSETFTPIEGVGYGSPFEYFKIQIKDPQNAKMFLFRIAYLLRKPSTILAVLKAWWLVRNCSKRYQGLRSHFNYWVYVWSNIGLKYWGLKEEDFDIHSVGEDFDINVLAQDIETPTGQTLTKPKRGEEKTELQERYTRKALNRLLGTKRK
ncbi:MAG: radical SAM protein [Gemmatimonadota bacterium]|nr:radical SAM protein [Gemmatimonadota bacterium]